MISFSAILPQHKELLFKWRNDPNVYRWCRQFDLLDWNSHCNWFDSLGNNKSIKMYLIKNNDIPVGVCGLTSIDLINQNAEFSLYISNEHQRNGYGEKALLKLIDHAFNSYPLYQIWGESFDGNPAIKMFSKIGFKFDGLRKEFYRRNGKFIDAYLFSITRKEFYADSKPATSNHIRVGDIDIYSNPYLKEREYFLISAK